MARVLIVEDDPSISQVLDFNLQREGFETHVAESGARALRLMRETPADLLILDLMLPDISGIDVCRELRSTPATVSVPILILTARGQEEDRLLGLEVGADDYMAKPFSLKELVLRSRALLRRAESTGSEDVKLSAGRVVIDGAAHRVFVDDEEIPLTHTEYRLLVQLLGKPGKVLSRRQLLGQVWNISANVETRTVDTHLNRLRRKLGPAGDQIETVRSIGYRYVVKD